MQNYTYEELVNKECDENIARFIKKGILVLDGYQYLTDSYLVSSILKQSDSDNMLDKMIFVTEHLGEFNVEKIIHYFGIDNTFAPKSKILKS